MRIPGKRPGQARRTGVALSALALVALPLVMLLSCYPGEITDIEELDAVGTVYDPKVNYASFQSFVLPQKVTVIDDRTPPSTTSPLTPQFEALMLQTIADRMTELNYTQVDSVADADVGIAVGVIISEQAVVTGGYPWGGCGYYPGWPCYGYYPPVGQVYEYDTGTVVMDMFDFTTAPLDTTAIVWQAGINGLASSTRSVNEDRIVSGINQAFKQSPYLKSGAP
jgi:hypothetical protein